VPVSVEQRPHALRELRHCRFDVPPCRHWPMIAPLADSYLSAVGSSGRAGQLSIHSGRLGASGGIGVPAVTVDLVRVQSAG
jgi:hypothetical protein